MNPTKKQLNYYINFVANSLMAATKTTDEFYQKHRLAIDHVAHFMTIKYPIPLNPLYRGILLTESGQKTLTPKPQVKFLSFSESKETALTFCDPNHFNSFAFRAAYENIYGYLIEHTPIRDEILFHYHWVGILKLEQLYHSIGELENMKEILLQKEVILKQHYKHFELIPFKESLYE